MKTNPCAAFLAALIAVSVLVSSRAHAQTTSPTVPVGTLTASPTVVQTGTKPTLKWSIYYPSVVKDYITITSPGTITAKRGLYCDIRVLGAGVTTQNYSGGIVYIRTEGEIRCNGNDWTSIFDGKNTDTIVQQQGILPKFNNGVDPYGQNQCGIRLPGSCVSRHFPHPLIP